MSEASEAKLDGATMQPNSGRGKFKKGDAILNKFCVDIKEYSKSFSLSKSVWAKICTDAVMNGSYRPALKVVLGDNDGHKVRIWCISDEDMHEYVELLERRDKNDNGG
jgi:hypothetical protein